MNTLFIFILFFTLGYAVPETKEHMQDDEEYQTAQSQTRQSTCDATAVFRTLDGKCNNIANPSFGQSFTPFARFVPAIYSGDGTMPSVAVSGQPLPNARLVSSTIHTDMDIPDAMATNAFVMFGQFLDHDVTETPFFPSIEGAPAPNDIPSCCGDNMEAKECIPITPIVYDPFFSKQRRPTTCLPLTRSLDCFESNTCTANAFNRKDTSGFELRDQENAITAFVDSSNIYGFDDNNAGNLRTFSGGKLRSTITASGNELLPILADPTLHAEEFNVLNNANCAGATEENEEAGCLFRGGDIRARENAILTTWHTVALREHNRVAGEIAMVNPRLTDEEVYQNARRIVGAEYQNIVYAEWLPLLLGQDAIIKFGIHLDGGNGYKPDTDASIRNSFATAAFRFGHSMLQGSPIQKTSTGSKTTLMLRDLFDNPETYAANDGKGAEEFLRGMFVLPSQTFDRFMTEDVTNFLFVGEEACAGDDLAARNLQRSRDHGLPGFLAYREFCGLSSHHHWYEGPSSIPKDVWKKLQQVYESPEDIDLFTGGLVETPVEGGLTGPVFNCLKGMQYQFIREGDRFFFTHTDQAGSFTANQIEAIKTRTLRDIICDNFPGIDEARPKTFWLSSPLESCSEKTMLDVGMFVPTPPMAPDNREYFIRSFHDQRVVDLFVWQHNTFMYTFHGGANQRWQWQGDQLINLAYNYVLTVQGNSHWTYTAAKELEAKDGTKRVLDIKRGEKRNGAHLILYQKHGGTNQKWALEKAV